MKSGSFQTPINSGSPIVLVQNAWATLTVGSPVPHLTINLAASYGAGAYAMSGRGYDPVFMFGWAGSRTAVMGSEQLAGVMDIVTREGAASRGTEVNEEELQGIKDFIVSVAEEQGTAYFMTGMMYDDGVIDPRDTRPALINALETLQTKRDKNPPKKHGNIPL